MVDNKESFIEAAIFQGTDGTKYAINPFATREHKTINEAVKSENNEAITLSCEPCDLSFENREELEHHNVEIHSIKKILSCHLCNAPFRRQDHLKRHIQSLHNNQKYCICPVCKKDCKRQDILSNHIKKKHSTAMEIFNCRQCNFQCNTLQELEKHELTHVLADRHLCPHCHTTCKRRDHMLRHVKSQHLNQFAVCPVCGQTYKRKDHVVRHVREKHKMGLLNGKLVSSSEILQATND